MSRSLALKGVSASHIAREYGLTARHWIRMAAQGKIPGAWQPSGSRGKWLFDPEAFARWRKGKQTGEASWQPSIAEERPIGRGPSVAVRSSGPVSRQRIDALLTSAIGNGSGSLRRQRGATGQGEPSKTHTSASLETIARR